MESSYSSGGGLPIERSPPYDGTNGDSFPQRVPSQEEESIEQEGQEQHHQWTAPPSSPPPPPPPPRPTSRQHLQQSFLPSSRSASIFISASGAQQQQRPPSHSSPAAAEDADVLLLLEEREVLREQLRQQIVEREELEKQHRSDKERLAVVEEALDETTRMYKRAKEAAQQCSKDATEAMAELRTSQVLREQLHTSLETALDQLQRLYVGMHAGSAFLLESDGQAIGLEQQPQQQADAHLPLDADTAYDLANAQRRASVIIHMLELLHERYAVTLTFRRAFALRIFFALWRGKFPCVFPENEEGKDEEEREYGREGVLVAAGGARGSARRMINTCVSLVEDILHHPEEHHQDQQQQQQHYRRPQQQQQLRFPSSTLYPTSSLQGGERESPVPSFVSAASSLVDRGRERLLRKEVADLQAKLQSREEVQNVLLDILSLYEKKNLDLSFDGSGEEVWWEEGSVSGGSRGEEDGDGDDLTTILSGGRSGSRGAGGRGRKENGGVEEARGGVHLIRRVENFCRVVQQALEERQAWTEHMEQSLVNCVCQSR